MQETTYEQISLRERLIDLALYLAVERRGRFATRADILKDVPGYERYDLDDEKDATAFRRTFENDKKRLREQGFAIETSEDGLSYRLDAARTFMADLEFTPEEVARLRAVGSAMLQSPDFPFASDLRIALAKIIGGLGWPAEPQAPTQTPAAAHARPQAAAPAQSDEAEKINKLRECIERRKVAQITYQSPGKKPAPRAIRPYGDFSYGGAWYCVAYDELHDDVRVLRVGRMLEVKPNASRKTEPDYEIPSGFNVEDYRGLPFQFGASPFEATFSIRPELFEMLQTRIEGKGRVERQSDAVVWTVPASDMPAAVAWCVEEGPGIVPLSPPELVAAYRSTLEAACKMGGEHDAS